MNLLDDIIYKSLSRNYPDYEIGPIQERLNKPVKTMFGMIMESLGVPQDDLAGFLAKRKNPLTGEVISSEPGVFEKALAGFMPYEVTPETAAFDMISGIKRFTGKSVVDTLADAPLQKLQGNVSDVSMTKQKGAGEIPTGKTPMPEGGIKALYDKWLLSSLKDEGVFYSALKKEQPSPEYNLYYDGDFYKRDSGGSTWSFIVRPDGTGKMLYAPEKNKIYNLAEYENWLKEQRPLNKNVHKYLDLAYKKALPKDIWLHGSYLGEFKGQKGGNYGGAVFTSKDAQVAESYGGQKTEGVFVFREKTGIKTLNLNNRDEIENIIPEVVKTNPDFKRAHEENLSEGITKKESFEKLADELNDQSLLENNAVDTPEFRATLKKLGYEAVESGDVKVFFNPRKSLEEISGNKFFPKAKKTLPNPSSPPSGGKSFNDLVEEARKK